MVKVKPNYKEDPRFVAGVALIGRTGASEFQIRYDDEQVPVIWVALAGYKSTDESLPPAPGMRYECDASVDPVRAVLRLCERLIDGGECQHCHRPTIFVPDTDTSLLDQMGCVYAWDPELATFRRGCEGDAS